MVMARIIGLVPRRASIFGAYALMTSGLVLCALLITIVFIYHPLLDKDLLSGLAALILCGFILFYMGYREYRHIGLDRVIENLLREVVAEDNVLKLPGTPTMKLIDLELIKYIGSRGSLKAILTYDVVDELRGDTVDLGVCMSKPQLFAASVSIHRGRTIIYNPSSPSEIGWGLGVKDRFIYRGLALYFQYMGYGFIAIPLYPSIPVSRRNSLKAACDGDYASAWLRFENNILHITLDYVKNRSRSARVKLSVIERIRTTSKVMEYELYSLELMEARETGNISREYRLPVLTETHVLIVPVDEDYIASRLLPIYEFSFRDHGGYRVIVTGYAGVVVKLILDLPLKRDVIDYAELTTRYAGETRNNR